MEDDNKQTVSVWMDTEPQLKQSALTTDAQADVGVVGAGIAGMNYGLSPFKGGQVGPLLWNKRSTKSH